MTDANEPFEKLRLELRRGVLVLAVLHQLTTARYGYNLIQRLAERGLDIEEGTLYPLMRRLEQQGLLTSEWDVADARPRKYYQISALGREVLSALTTEWLDTVSMMNRILEDETDE